MGGMCPRQPFVKPILVRWLKENNYRSLLWHCLYSCYPCQFVVDSRSFRREECVRLSSRFVVPWASRQVGQFADEPFAEHEQEDDAEGEPVVPEGDDADGRFGAGLRVEVVEQVGDIGQVI